MGLPILRSFKVFAHGWLIRAGIDIRRLRPDRRILEQVIFPHLLTLPDCHRILFIGCAWYTVHYPKLFSHREFWTLDRDVRSARFGATRHIVDGCDRVANHLPPHHLDVIVCNGVYGHGLDDESGLRDTLAGFHRVLRPRGTLVFGWNNVPLNDPLGLGRADFRAELFAGFEPGQVSPFATWIYEVPGRNRHTYAFLERT